MGAELRPLWPRCGLSRCWFKAAVGVCTCDFARRVYDARRSGCPQCMLRDETHGCSSWTRRTHHLRSLAMPSTEGLTVSDRKSLLVQVHQGDGSALFLVRDLQIREAPFTLAFNAADLAQNAWRGDLHYHHSFVKLCRCAQRTLPEECHSFARRGYGVKTREMYMEGGFGRTHATNV